MNIDPYFEIDFEKHKKETEDDGSPFGTRKSEYVMGGAMVDPEVISEEVARQLEFLPSDGDETHIIGLDSKDYHEIRSAFRPRDAYNALTDLEKNPDNIGALEMLDEFVVLFNRIAGDIKTFQGVQKRIRALAGDILEELGSTSEKTSHGRVVRTKAGTSRSVDWEAINEHCKNDSDFADAFFQFVTEKTRRGGIRIS
jgi:hypothetical protein